MIDFLAEYELAKSNTAYGRKLKSKWNSTPGCSTLRQRRADKKLSAKQRRAALKIRAYFDIEAVI